MFIRATVMFCFKLSSEQTFETFDLQMCLRHCQIAPFENRKQMLKYQISVALTFENLYQDPKSIGNVQLPLVPLLNSLVSGEKSDLSGWFECLTLSNDGALICQTDNLDPPRPTGTNSHKSVLLPFSVVDRVAS